MRQFDVDYQVSLYQKLYTVVEYKMDFSILRAYYLELPSLNMMNMKNWSTKVWEPLASLDLADAPMSNGTETPSDGLWMTELQQ